MRILVVDDDEDARDLTEGALLSAGYTDIVTAASGWDALKALDVGRTTDEDAIVDVVLLDILMSEMDGVEVCARIRNDPRYADLPIIMVTALADMNSLANAFVAGATDYLTKPVNRIELVARVRAALRLKAELDRRQARERELLAFVSSWGERRAGMWIDEATGLFVGEVAEAYLIACPSDAEELVSVIALRLDRVDAERPATGATAEPSPLAQVARAVRRLAASVGIVAAAYKNGMIILVAPELGAAPARELAEALHATVQKLHLWNSEAIASDHVTASVAAITGHARCDVERIKMLTQAITTVQQAAASGGNRVVSQSADGATSKSGNGISEGLKHQKEIGATG
jgi:PleD family two-component response regulator